MYVKLAGETILVRRSSPGANDRVYTHHPVARAQGEQRRTMYAPGFPPHRSVYIEGGKPSAARTRTAATRNNVCELARSKYNLTMLP